MVPVETHFRKFGHTVHNKLAATRVSSHWASSEALGYRPRAPRPLASSLWKTVKGPPPKQLPREPRWCFHLPKWAHSSWRLRSCRPLYKECIKLPPLSSQRLNNLSDSSPSKSWKNGTQTCLEQAGKAQGARKIIDSRFRSKPHVLMVEAKAGVKTLWLGNLENILHALWMQ